MKVKDYSLVGQESQRAIDNGLANAKWYQSPVPAESMSTLIIRRNIPGIIDTIIWLGLIIFSGFLFVSWWGNWYAVFPYVVYSVLYASTSDSRWHESSHGTVFKSSILNNILYEIASFMVVRQSTVWKWSHARHHSDTIVRGRDPEISVKTPPDVKALILTFFGYAALFEYKKIVMNALGRINKETLQFVPETELKRVILTARIYLSIYLMVIASTIVFETMLPLMLIGFSTFLGSWLMPVYGYTQHAGLQENVLDHRLNCRTVYMNRMNRFLYWNMNYHVEHHMYPLVPYYNLPELHQQIKQDCPKPYSGIKEAFTEIIPAIIKQIENPEYYVKREIPPTARPTANTDILVGDESNVKNGWIKVCSNSAISLNSIQRFDFEEKSYAIYRTSENEFYASDGFCTHGNSHLSEGAIIGKQIECAKHNGRFCLKTGSPCRNPVKIAVQIYEIDIRENSIYLKLDF